MTIKTNRALTLTELIAGTIIFGIVIVGVTAVDFAMRRSHQSTSQNSVLAMQTSAIMLHITKNIGVATGDRGTSGIVVNPTNIWIRMEDPNPLPPDPDPSTYADDIWVSYTFIPANFTLYFCTVPDSTTPCTNIDENLGRLAAFTANLAVNDSAGTQNLYVEIILVNRPNPADFAKPLENPEYTLTSRTQPASSSF